MSGIRFRMPVMQFRMPWHADHRSACLGMQSRMGVYPLLKQIGKRRRATTECISTVCVCVFLSPTYLSL
eukprot:NODE_3166_length_378_cov_43.978723_g3084_i0.p1 GENE.NODE_3166_length_378_cov_43.978723_g3084_i0~~NODE_3166_length_378_cov_43.978723_g3084_i0.p1  ORF type:complete len:69 (-),score=1.99 NODE_3166_length_378_cov_43.978723_g3084_i0:58-264(-)